ncbi:MAG: CHAT domain-containing protein, partial [Chloroflexaceae bacterium]|nr:CHAT domain-containing protein [Chloroflexaceae bacterium]
HRAIQQMASFTQSDAERRQMSAENATLYAQLVFCCLHNGQSEAAFEYAVAAKGRAFVDLLHTARFDLATVGADQPELATMIKQRDALRTQIDALLTQLGRDSESSRGDGPPTLAAESTQRTAAQQQLQQLYAAYEDHWQAMTGRYPALTATERAPDLNAAAAQQLAHTLGATLVEYFQHDQGWCAFVVTAQGVRHVPLPAVNEDLLLAMIEWIIRVENHNARNERSKTDPLYDWYDAVIAPLELPRDRPLILAPFGALHILPLNVARNRESNAYLVDEYQLAFAPGLGALSVIWQQAQQTPARATPAEQPALLTVAYPGHNPQDKSYLHQVIPEASAIAAAFTHTGRCTPLHAAAATPTAVLTQARQHQLLHIGCHGLFNPEKPDESGLVLHDGRLTIQRIISEMHLAHADLVTLAACLSGRPALNRGDEAMSLAQSMLTAGARVVTGSLWSVDDTTTSVLFTDFYQQVASGTAPAIALAQATRTIRQQPQWQHPFYWAAFQVSGLAHQPSARPTRTTPPASSLATAEQAHLQAISRGGKSMSNDAQQHADDLFEIAILRLDELYDDASVLLRKAGAAQLTQIMERVNQLAQDTAALADDDETGLLDVVNQLLNLIEEDATLRERLIPADTDIAAARAQRTVTQHVAAQSQKEQKRAAHIAECKQTIHNDMRRVCTEFRRLLQQPTAPTAPSKRP